jgi:predicted AlkP superfamily pyrophosphatase or phosphodiesterase
MKKLALACSIFFSAFSFAQDNHVILISIDGLRPEFYKDPTWNMVHLRQAMETGAYANGVNGVFPSVTYPSHTTMVTGVRPIVHGVHFNTPSEPMGVTGNWNWFYENIKVPTIFSEAEKQGLKTASMFWPVSVNSPATYNLPEYWYLPKTKGTKRNMKQALTDKAKPAGFYEELENKAMGVLDSVDFDDKYLGLDENLARASAYVIRTYKPSFLALHLVTVDHFEHEEGRDGDKVRAAIAGVDRALKTIMEAVEKAGIKSKTTFIITGDHGFVDIHSALSPNVLLAKAGLYNPEKPEQWKAYFHTAGGSAFLHVKDPKDKKTMEAVETILENLPEQEKKLFEVKSRKKLDKIGADPNALLALAPIQGITFNTLATGSFIRAAKGGTHGFFPDFKEIQTGFVAFGKGIKKGTVIPEMSLVDIAPVIAKLLQIQFPAGEGNLYPGMFTDK